MIYFSLIWLRKRVDVLFKYRLLLAIVFGLMVLIAGYYIDLDALRENNIDLIANQNELRQSLTVLKNKSVTRRANKNLTAARLQQEMLMIAAGSQVLLDSITKADVSANAPDQDEFYQLKLYSTYPALLGFLRNINQSPAHFVFRRITIQSGPHEQLQTEMILRPNTDKTNQTALAVIDVKNPFCTNANTMADRTEQPDQLQRFNLSKLKMLGTLDLAGKTSAIIMFPNGVSKEVSCNMVLGKERAVIAAINSHRVLLYLPSQQSFQIKAE